jgi:hypothetical protein
VLTHTRHDRGAMPKPVLAVVGVLAGVVLLAVLVFVGFGALVEEGTDDDVQAAVQEAVDEGGPVEVSEEAYARIERGMSKEQVQALLRPARPVDAAELDEYRLREPETVAAECVYYAGPSTRDILYRFCFEEDRLFDKTFVLPDRDGIHVQPAD